MSAPQTSMSILIIYYIHIHTYIYINILYIYIFFTSTKRWELGCKIWVYSLHIKPLPVWCAIICAHSGGRALT